MKYSYAGAGMIGIGLVAFAIVLIFQYITINNESDYYSLKEAMEASMLESIDWVYYRNTYEDNNKAEIKILEEKFVSNFTKRFINNTIGNNNGYVLQFYDIMEKPPKATVVIANKSLSMGLADYDFDVINNLTGILEANIAESDANGGCTSGTVQISSSTVDYVTDNLSESSDNEISLSVPGGIDRTKPYWVDSVSYDGVASTNCADAVPDVAFDILVPNGTDVSSPVLKIRTSSLNIRDGCQTKFKYKVIWKYYNGCTGG